VKIGVYIFPTDECIQPIELAKAVEERGLESLFFPEHSHIPTARTTPWGGRKGAPDLPPEYWRSHDQFVALGAAAAVTSTIKLGTGICLVAQRDPIYTAKAVASLDVISEGRAVFGIGYGWNKEEMSDHGTEYLDRRARLRECILAMKELWTKDEAEFHGDYVNFDKSWQWPKPKQSPHPPIIMGGSAGPKTIADIVDFCDGWMPIALGRPAAQLFEQVREAAEAEGRSRDTLQFGAFGGGGDPEVLSELGEAGANRVVLTLPQAGPDVVLPVLDKYAALIDTYA